MSRFGSRCFSLCTLSFIVCTSPALANITSMKFYARQVHDAQRSPEFPTANTSFTASYLRDPFRDNYSPYKLTNGEYIQLVYVGGACNDGEMGLNRYSARGELLETVHMTGHIYGLSPEGFLHDSDKNIGTFFSTYPLTSGEVSYIPISGPHHETCDALKAYK